MKKIALFLTITIALTHFGFAQTNLKTKAETRPTVQDLDFMIGTWEITFKFYDTHAPEKGVIFTEKGTQKCEYDLDLNGVPMFITCKGELSCDSGKIKGRTRTIQESIRYGPFVNAFERIGLYSNWPGTGLETFQYEPNSHEIVIKGELAVQKGMLERYEDVYQFNEDFSYFERKNVANFSDMPITKFNLTLEGTGRKVRE